MSLVQKYFTRAPNAIPVVRVASRIWRRQPSINSSMYIYCRGHTHRDYCSTFGRHGHNPIVEIEVSYPKAFTSERTMWEITSMRHRVRQYTTAELDTLGLTAAAYSPSSVEGVTYLAYGLRPWRGRRGVSHQFDYDLEGFLRSFHEVQRSSRGQRAPLRPAPCSWPSSGLTQAESASIDSSNMADRDDLIDLRKNRRHVENYLRDVRQRRQWVFVDCTSRRRSARVADWIAQLQVHLFKAGHKVAESIESMSESRG